MTVLLKRRDLIFNLQETEKLNQLFHLLYNFMFTYFTKLCMEITALANHCLLAHVCCQTMTKSILQTGKADSVETSQIGSLFFHNKYKKHFCK